MKSSLFSISSEMLNIRYLSAGLTAALLILPGCGGKKPSFAIRDFTPALQPHLTQAISTGIVGYDDATHFIKNRATDGEIVMLSRAESPILRAIALQQMVSRPTFHHFSVIMRHLDDTAIIARDAGEWGVWFLTVSDYMINQSKWKTNEDRQRTEDEILMRHTYLKSAYTGLYFMPLLPKYYDTIRAMAMRDRPFEGETEEALFALAKYRKKSDIPLIKDLLLSNDWQIGSSSFALMLDYPDTSYMQVLEKYYRQRFFKMISRNERADLLQNFISTLASFRRERSAATLTSILNRQPAPLCTLNIRFINYLKRILYYAIRDNPCPAYTSLREKINYEVMAMLKSDSANQIAVDPCAYPSDPVKEAEPVRW